MDALLSCMSRSILISTMNQAKSVEEISKDSQIPLSTCYEKVAKLSVRGVLKRERIIITQTGKRYALYRAAIRTVHVEFGPGGLNVVTVANDTVEPHDNRSTIFAAGSIPAFLGPDTEDFNPTELVSSRWPKAYSEV